MILKALSPDRVTKIAWKQEKKDGLWKQVWNKSKKAEEETKRIKMERWCLSLPVASICDSFAQPVIKSDNYCFL